MAQKSKPLLVIVFGLPGTGKTTMAHLLSKALKARHMNTDMLRTALGKRDRYTDEEKGEVYRILLERAEGHLENGQDLIVDGTFSREAYRESIRQLAERTGTTLKWIRTMASEEVVQTRVSQRRTFSQADFDVYRKIRDEFEPSEEAALEVWTDRQTQKEALQQMLQFLSI
jgi:predicted kinase